jgi:hypothetical protein
MFGFSYKQETNEDNKIQEYSDDIIILDISKSHMKGIFHKIRRAGLF